MTIRVVLADDQALMRADFRMLIQTAPDIEVVGEPRRTPGRYLAPPDSVNSRPNHQ